MGHEFLSKPNRTLLTLSIPVLFSLVAEPVTGVVDTAFVATLGAVSLAALGVGTMALSSFFWIFNFLAIGTQTEVARASGRRKEDQLSRLASAALSIGLLTGIPVALAGFLFSSEIAELMGAAGGILSQSVTYMRIRWLASPAVLVTLAAFGTLRGLQDMRTPLKVAVGVNLMNVVLDAILIFGLGPIPALGIAGAASATTVSQWAGAIWVLWNLSRRVGLGFRLRRSDIFPLLRIGRDLFIRTGLLTLFLLLTTRSATRAGAETGAAHQAIRQVWMLTALFLDSFAVSGQSLVAYFMGSEQVDTARRVASVVLVWSLVTGGFLGFCMWFGESLAIKLLVPQAAVAVFIPAWQVAAASQPLNAISFGTDGIHWGTGDFGFLRNVVILATVFGATSLILLDDTEANTLTWIWWITGGWSLIRASFGLLRIWPGIGRAPLQP